MHTMLIIDGDEPSRAVEATTIMALARASAKFSRVDVIESLNDIDRTQTSWSIVWFTGHMTYRKKKQARTFERKVGRRYVPIVPTTFLDSVKASLLVLSSCNTAIGVSGYRARSVLAHVGDLEWRNGLVFTTYFMAQLCKLTRRDRLETSVIDEAYKCAVALRMADRGWVLTHQER